MDDKHGRFPEDLIDRLLDHPELIRAIMDAYFARVDLETCCWIVLATTGCSV